MTLTEFANGLIRYSKDSEFPIQNLPYGVYSLKGETSRKICTRIGDCILDLYKLSALGVFNGDLLKNSATAVFSKDTLNDFMALGRPAWTEARRTIQSLLGSSNKADIDKLSQSIHCFSSEEELASKICMHLPMLIGDYTDFYASKEHATNVGTMFRGAENALNPNWLCMPIGYHGRSSSIYISGTPIMRPCGQIKPKEGPPFFGKSQKLDIELEMAFVVGMGNKGGQPIKIENATDHIFGMVLLNDWSARDIQAWEYVPLGPFLGKNFGTTISPWIVTLDALQPFLAATPTQTPSPLPYLREHIPANYDIELEATLKPSSSKEDYILCKTNLKYMYWSIRQQLAHHTVNGCNMRAGDLCGTGTLSGPTADSFGSLLELSWNGTKPIQLGSNATESRTFLEDGDTVTLTGICHGIDYKIGFGKCVGQVLPAREF